MCTLYLLESHVKNDCNSFYLSKNDFIFYLKTEERNSLLLLFWDLAIKYVCIHPTQWPSLFYFIDFESPVTI